MSTATAKPKRVETTTVAVVADPCPPDDPRQAAKDAGLRYVTDAEPGFQRERRGSRVVYRDADGVVVRDPKTLERIAKLAIPPAWTDVWVCARANGHLQATGRDAKGRKQYRYHPRWREVRDETKYGRMLDFGRALPAIRARVDADLGRRGLPREKVLAAIVRLLERTLIRVGNEEYARTNNSYGLTTLLDDHVEVKTSGVRFLFRGKSGKEHEIGLQDRRLARIVRGCRDLPGQTLFQYLGDDGEPHAIGSADVNDYLREISGQPFTAKDFRTWFGSVVAAETLLELDREAAMDPRRAVPAAISLVAEQLGNTPAVCRQCYVHPVVLEAHESGRLADLDATVPAGGEGGYGRGERLLLALLDS